MWFISLIFLSGYVPMISIVYHQNRIKKTEGADCEQERQSGRQEHLGNRWRIDARDRSRLLFPSAVSPVIYRMHIGRTGSWSDYYLNNFKFSEGHSCRLEPSGFLGCRPDMPDCQTPSGGQKYSRHHHSYGKIPCGQEHYTIQTDNGLEPGYNGHCQGPDTEP